MPRINLLDLPREEMEAFFIDLGEKRYRAEQLLKWIYHYNIDDFSAMTNISQALIGRLHEIAEIRAPEEIGDQLSRDGTRKWLLQLEDGGCVEAVFIPEEERGTLCVSSQVGCALDCTFCATAQQGFNRNLSVSEIIGQVRLIRRDLDSTPRSTVISNVVLMGMGEPLLNYANVVGAMRLMMEDLAVGLARKRITLSTAGVVPGIDRLGQDCPVSLAISLHAPNDELRNQLVPLNRKYPLAELLAACRRYVECGPKPQITFEYVMLRGINDSTTHARELVRLLQGIPAKFNLIRFNPFPGSRYSCSTDDAIERFQEILMRAGLFTMTRKPRGADIDAACGQLVGWVADRSRRSMRQKESS